MVIEPIFCLFAAGVVLVVPLPWVLGLGTATMVHELGHFLALKWWGIPVYRLRLTAGGVILETGPMTSREEAYCALAGPAAGAVLLLFAKLLPRTALCALCQTVWNLAPIGNRDGARVLRQILPRGVAVAEGVVMGLILLACPLMGWPGIWLGVAVLSEKFLAKNRPRHYNRPTIDKEVRL